MQKHHLAFFHAFHVSFTVFIFLYAGLQIACPHCRSHPPPHASDRRSVFPPIPSPSLCPSLNRLPLIFLLKSKSLHPPHFRIRCRNFTLLICCLILLAGDVEVNPGPVQVIPPSVNLATFNIRSISSITEQYNKPEILKNMIHEFNIDILCLSETWLQSDTLPATINSFLPPSFSFAHCPRPQGGGGGIGFVYNSKKICIKNVKVPIYSSFEIQCISFTVSPSFSIRPSSITTNPFIIINIYRPPSLSKATFITEFTSLLENFISSSSEIIITGDLNLHVDNLSAPYSTSFLDLLETFNLKQHINFPTHISGHTLDLLITRSTSTLVSAIDHTFSPISDHELILSTLSIPTNSRSPRIVKLTRPINTINTVNFANDIRTSCLYTSPATTLAKYIEQFTTTLTTLLDKHAPQKTTSCLSRPHKPFITPEIKNEKSKRSKLETIFRKDRSPQNKANFMNQAKVVAKLITTARRLYFRNLIANCSGQPKKLWAALDNLLCRKPPPTLPNSISPPTLASAFLQYFDDKITNLCARFTPLTPATVLNLNPPPPSTPLALANFAPATEAEVRLAILSSSNSTCSLDLIPTKLIKHCIDVLLPPITTLINLSLAEGIFPTSFKNALVKPLLKKYSLPSEDLASYRPISNLSFISKILERIIHTRITTHLDAFPSTCPFQSAYRKFHSTETALLRIQNDLLLAIDKRKLSALVLLDLSAAFDTIDHSILLSRLSSTFGVTGSALSLLSSYLTNRTQSVSVNSHSTLPSQMLTGVPQGSVLGPLLFTLYTTPLSYLFSNSPVSYHFYADDTQLYISFDSSDVENSLSTLSAMLDSVHAWLTANRLSVNPSKTEYLIIGTPQQRSKVTTTSSISFQGSDITPTDSTRNLGVLFDKDLSLKPHISSVCKTSYYHIRQLRQVRSSLDTNSAIVLANSLVSSKLDYCNSLYYGLPAASLDKLQRVQNSLARVIFPSVRRHHHITPTLKQLHWLPIRQRIIFKIASLTYKTLHNHKPSYLFQLLNPYVPTRNLRSLDKSLLTIPDIRSANGRRSFAFAAPTIWNSLPLVLRSSPTLALFLSGLKMHLFPP
jgi:Reverse transcriptase (RNA-dependent DNA polymerase)/Endonuclease-reverse transcriptase